MTTYTSTLLSGTCALAISSNVPSSGKRARASVKPVGDVRGRGLEFGVGGCQEKTRETERAVRANVQGRREVKGNKQVRATSYQRLRGEGGHTSILTRSSIAPWACASWPGVHTTFDEDAFTMGQGHTYGLVGLVAPIDGWIQGGMAADLSVETAGCWTRPRTLPYRPWALSLPRWRMMTIRPASGSVPPTRARFMGHR